MALNAFPRRGCFYWVEIPGEPTGKTRPALVVSVDVRNRLSNDVLVVPASSVLRQAPTHVRIRKGQGGVPKDCVVKCEQITTLAKSYLSESALGGELPNRLLTQVERAVIRSIGVAID